MRRPLALPPGKSAKWLRRTPMVCAGVIYGTWFVTSLVVFILMHANDENQAAWKSLASGAIAAYLMFGLILLLLPAAVTATVLASERDRGTMEAMVLTPSWHDEIARGRFWHAAAPWLRLFLWMLPMYLMLGVCCSGMYEQMSGKDTLGMSVALMFVPKFYVAAISGFGLTQSPGVPCGSLLVIGLRMLRDVIDLMVALSVAYYFSARMWRGVHAVLLSMVTVPALMLSIFMAPEWFTALIMAIFAATSWLRNAVQIEVIITLYAIAGVLICVLQVWMCSALIRRVAKRFDAYALGQVRGF